MMDETGRAVARPYKPTLPPAGASHDSPTRVRAPAPFPYVHPRQRKSGCSLAAVLIACLLLFGAGRARAQGEALVPGTYQVTQPQGDRTRSYLITVPQGYDPAEPVPLVLVLHGQSGSGERTRGYSGFDALADEFGFAVVYPDGVDGSWNDGRPGADDTLPDDLAFFSALIDRVGRLIAVDRDRVYAAGISAGGMMAYRLACALPETVAAAAVIAATMPAYLTDDCDGSPPIPLLVIHGTDDPILPWMGIRETFLSARDTQRYWADHNTCLTALPPIAVEDGDPSDGTRVLLSQYGDCANGARFTFYTVVFGGHTWPGQTIPAIGLGATSMDIDATRIIWHFFEG